MDERGAQALVNHLNNAAWSGELEGWLKQAPEVRFEGPEEEPGSWIEAAEMVSLGVEHEDAHIPKSGPMNAPNDRCAESRR